MTDNNTSSERDLGSQQHNPDVSSVASHVSSSASQIEPKRYNIDSFDRLCNVVNDENVGRLMLDLSQWLFMYAATIAEVRKTHPKETAKLSNTKIAKASFTWIDDGKTEIKESVIENAKTGEVRKQIYETPLDIYAKVREEDQGTADERSVANPLNQGTEPSLPKPSTAPTQIEEVLKRYVAKDGVYLHREQVIHLVEEYYANKDAVINWDAVEHFLRDCLNEKHPSVREIATGLRFIFNQGTGSSEAGTERSKDVQPEIQTPVTKTSQVPNISYQDSQDKPDLITMTDNTPPCSEQMQGGYTIEDIYEAIKYGVVSSREHLSLEERRDIFLQSLQPVPEAPKQ